MARFPVGLALIALSACIMSLMMVLVTTLETVGDTVSSWQVVTIRCAQQCVYAWLFACYTGKSVFGPRNKRVLLFFRGFIGSFAFACYYFAVAYIPLGDATVFFMASPLFAAVLGHQVLGLFSSS